jgi:hypothetical protein
VVVAVFAGPVGSERIEVASVVGDEDRLLEREARVKESKSAGGHPVRRLNH